MTVIAYKNGTMAADTRAWAGRTKAIGSKIKCRRLPNGWLAGVSCDQPGASEVILDALEEAGGDLLKAYMAGEPKGLNSDARGYSVLVVSRDGHGFLADDSWTFSGPIEAPYFAIGSGADFAWAALELGASPEVAVSVACKGDPYSAPPITIISHDAG